MIKDKGKLMVKQYDQLNIELCYKICYNNTHLRLGGNNRIEI